jgi:PAS domain S-box-containing protein
MRKSNASESTTSLQHELELHLKINNSKNKTPVSDADSEKFTTLFDFAPFAYITLSETQIITGLNHAALLLFGREHEDLIRKKFELFVTEESKIEFKKFVLNLNSSSIKHTTIITILNNEERPIHVQLTGIAASDKDEYYIIATDLTERIHSEQKIKMLSLTIEYSPASIIITNKKGKIEYVNNNYVKVSGYKAENVVGKNISVLQSDNTLMKEYKLFLETIIDGNIWEGEFYTKKKSGELYCETARVIPIKNAKGLITHFVAITEDVTERKLIENKMYKIAWHQSHQVRSPLSNIMGIIAAMKLKLTLEEKLNLLSKLDESAQKLDSAIHAIVGEANLNYK